MSEKEPRAGAVHIYATIIASSSVLATWEPAKVAAFFAGIAKVFPHICRAPNG